MPDLRAKATSLGGALASLDAQLLDRETYLALAENLEGFLSRLRDTSEVASIEDRQKVVRSVVKEVLVGPERVVIRHSIPAHRPFRHGGYRLRLRSHFPPARQHRPPCPRRGVGQRWKATGDAGALLRRLRRPLPDTGASRSGSGPGRRDPGTPRAAIASRQDQDRRSSERCGGFRLLGLPSPDGQVLETAGSLLAPQVAVTTGYGFHQKQGPCADNPESSRARSGRRRR